MHSHLTYARCRDLRLIERESLRAVEERLAKLPPRPAVTKSRKRRNRRSKDLNIQVRALVHPTVDHEKLASALLEHVDNEPRRQAEDNSKAA